jgi:hypothetical protein
MAVPVAGPRSGMAIGDSIPAEFLGIQVQVGPAVSLHPAFILGSKDKVVGGSIAAGSTLILDGEDITLKNVHVDGCLIVRAAPGAKVGVDGHFFRISSLADDRPAPPRCPPRCPPLNGRIDR